MGRLLGIHEVSVIGDTIELASGAATARTQILANADKAGPKRYVIMCDEDVYLRMGSATATADATDFLLPAGASITVTVEHPNHSYLAALQKTTAGTVKITALSELAP